MPKTAQRLGSEADPSQGPLDFDLGKMPSFHSGIAKARGEYPTSPGESMPELPAEPATETPTPAPESPAVEATPEYPRVVPSGIRANTANPVLYAVEAGPGDRGRDHLSKRAAEEAMHNATGQGRKPSRATQAIRAITDKLRSLGKGVGEYYSRGRDENAVDRVLDESREGRVSPEAGKALQGRIEKRNRKLGRKNTAVGMNLDPRLKPQMGNADLGDLDLESMLEGTAVDLEPAGGAMDFEGMTFDENDFAPSGGEIDEALRAALKAAGIAVPEANADQDPMEFLKSLSDMLTQRAMDENGGEVPSESDSIDVLEPETAAMSVQKEKGEQNRKAKRTPETVQKGIEAANQRRMSLGTHAAVVNAQVSNTANDLKHLLDTGRVTPDEYNKCIKVLEQPQRLSLSSNGALATPKLHSFIESRRSLPEQAVVPVSQRMSADTGVDSLRVPESYTGDVSPEDAKAFVDEQASRLPELS